MKAILIVDVPDDIADAYENLTVDYFLYGEPIEYDKSFKENIIYVENVKLRPLPQMKYISLGDTHNDLIYEMGWNACLDEILGEAE